jgi:hypothetical protein
VMGTMGTHSHDDCLIGEKKRIEILRARTLKCAKAKPWCVLSTVSDCSSSDVPVLLQSTRAELHGRYFPTTWSGVLQI